MIFHAMLLFIHFSMDVTIFSDHRVYLCAVSAAFLSKTFWCMLHRHAFLLRGPECICAFEELMRFCTTSNIFHRCICFHQNVHLNGVEERILTDMASHTYYTNTSLNCLDEAHNRLV